MKKICFVTTVPLTLKTFVLPTAIYLHEHTDWDISFICDNDPALAKELPSFIHYYPVKMARGIHLSGIGSTRALARIFRRERFDMVQYATPNAACYASIAAWRARIPVRLYCQWGIAYVGFTGLRRKIFKVMEQLICRLSTRIEPDSFGNLHFSHAEKLYDASKSMVIWNGSACGVNLAKFAVAGKPAWRAELRAALAIPADAVVFIFVGRVTRDKGIDELLCAAQRLMATYPDVYLLMVGPNESTDGINATLYQWSLEEPRVIYCGYTNEVERYMAAGDVYVLPSYREGFGTSVIEAEAMGLPVIVTDIPGPTDAMLADHTGLVVPKADAQQLGDAMESLYRDPARREAFGQAGYRRAAEGFEQSAFLEKVMEDRAALLASAERGSGQPSST